MRKNKFPYSVSFKHSDTVLHFQACSNKVSEKDEIGHVLPQESVHQAK